MSETIAGSASWLARLSLFATSARSFSSTLGSRAAMASLGAISTRPAESISFWRPVKNGWHDEQISTRRSFRVERVWNDAPHAQTTVTSWYSGWILAFIATSWAQGGIP